MDDQPPNPTENNPLKEITSSQQTDEEVADDQKKRETEVDRKKDKITDDDSVDLSADSSTGSRIDDADNQNLGLQVTEKMTEQETVEMTDKIGTLETDNEVVDDRNKRKTKVDGDNQSGVGDGKKKKIADDPSAMTSSTKKIDPVPLFLFEKELDSEDTNTILNRLVIEHCRDVMTRALATAQEVKKCDHVRVTTTDPKGVEYQLRFMRYSNGRYVLHHQWGDIVTAHGLREGDMVAGWGNVFGDGEIRMNLDIFVFEESSESDEESRENVVSSEREQVVRTNVASADGSSDNSSDDSN